MMQTDLMLIEPLLLFISDDEWRVEDKKIQYLENLLTVLKEVDEIKICKIMWTEELESILWTEPQLSPWKDYNNGRNQLVPILYKYLNSNVFLIKTTSDVATCSLKIDAPNGNSLITVEYLKMINATINDSNLFFYYSNKEIKNISFTSSANRTYSPLILNTKVDYYKLIPFETTLWPTDSSDREIKKMKKAIEIVKEVNHPGQKLFYTFSFSKNFIRSISDLEMGYRRNLINKIAKRLCLSTVSASQDGQLQDEFIAAKNIRRMRVTPRPTSTRIHYKVLNSSIEFVEYYGPGAHDDGL